MAEKDWYYVKNDKREGPVSENKLLEMSNAGHLMPDTLIWSESLTEWTAASEIISLRVNDNLSSAFRITSKDQTENIQEENNSGQGKSSTIPDQIRKWNWGAFFLNWIWGLGNRNYIALLCLIPFVGFVMAFVLGAKGNKWAWQKKRWTSIEHFKDVQKTWALVGLFVAIIPTIAISAAIAIPNYLYYQGKAATVEAQQELTNISKLEGFYYAENLKYGSLNNVGWAKPAGKTRYTYSLEYSSTTFMAWAEGNLDNDDTLDVWSIDQDNVLAHDVDDTKE